MLCFHLLRSIYRHKYIFLKPTGIGEQVLFDYRTYLFLSKERYFKIFNWVRPSQLTESSEISFEFKINFYKTTIQKHTVYDPNKQFTIAKKYFMSLSITKIKIRVLVLYLDTCQAANIDWYITYKVVAEIKHFSTRARRWSTFPYFFRYSLWIFQFTQIYINQTHKRIHSWKSSQDCVKRYYNVKLSI